jgi:hypothetical protein
MKLDKRLLALGCALLGATMLAVAQVPHALASCDTNGLRFVATLQTAASSFRIAATRATLRGFPLETKRS